MQHNHSIQKSGPRTIIGSLNAYGIVALSGMVGPLVLGIAGVTAAFSHPGYDPIRESISSLALTPMGWLQSIGFLVFGLLTEVFVVGFFFSIRRGRGFALGIAVLVCAGFGLLLLGAFQTDPVGTSHTIEGTIHSVAAAIVLWLFPIACLLIAPSLRHDPYWKNLYVYTIITGVFAFLLLIVLLWLPVHLSWFGLYERILVASMVIWVEVMAIRLLRLSLTEGWKN
jgi:hypothetical protein